MTLTQVVLEYRSVLDPRSGLVLADGLLPLCLRVELVSPIQVHECFALSGTVQGVIGPGGDRGHPDEDPDHDQEWSQDRSHHFSTVPPAASGSNFRFGTGASALGFLTRGGGEELTLPVDGVGAPAAGAGRVG